MWDGHAYKLDYSFQKRNLPALETLLTSARRVGNIIIYIFIRQVAFSVILFQTAVIFDLSEYVRLQKIINRKVKTPCVQCQSFNLFALVCKTAKLSTNVGVSNYKMSASNAHRIRRLICFFAEYQVQRNVVLFFSVFCNGLGLCNIRSLSR